MAMYKNISLIILLMILGFTGNVTAQTPTDNLANARRVFNGGDYQTAQAQFEAILIDPATTPDEKRQALHWRGRSELLAGDFATAITTLTEFLTQYPDDQLNRATQYNLGLAYEQNEQLGAAFEAYQASLIPDDSINVHIYERMGDISLEIPDNERAITAYQAGVDSTTNDNFQLALRQKIADVEIVRDNPTGAIAQYETILQISKDDMLRAKILKFWGDALTATGNSQAGYEKYLEAINNYPTVYESYLALVELVNADIPVDDLQRGLVDYHAGSYEAAIEALERYLDSPQPDKAGDALWLLGLSQRDSAKYDKAVSTFQRLIDDYPDHSYRAKANLEIGKVLGWQNKIDEAKTYYRKFAAGNPATFGAGEALWRAGILELNNDMLAEAYVSLQDMSAKYPMNDYADEALYWAGRAAFRLENYEDAAKTWGKLASRYPKSELSSFGSYWQAKSLIKLGRETEARPILETIVDKPLDYYALRARDLLAGTQPHSIPLAMPTQEQLNTEQAEAELWLREWLKPSPTQEDLTQPTARLQNNLAFQRGQKLLEIGWRDKALLEFETTKDNFWSEPLEMYQLALYFQEQNMGRLSILSAARVNFLSPTKSIEDAPIFIQRLFYPVYFPELLFAEAESQGIDPALAIALMRQESLFEYSAQSVAGARGLMQVMPATGEYIAMKIGTEKFTVDQLWQPHISIKFGTWYISQQLEFFDQHQFAALAAYNAGPGNVQEWLQDDDLDIFVEEIPFLESRMYIRLIYVNLAAYRRLYGT
jgi:soluble lytic murein transglycosylase